MNSFRYRPSVCGTDPKNTSDINLLISHSTLFSLQNFDTKKGEKKTLKMDQQQQYCLKWSNYSSNLATAFSNLFNTETLTDVTLFCEGLFTNKMWGFGVEGFSWVDHAWGRRFESWNFDWSVKSFCSNYQFATFSFFSSNYVISPFSNLFQKILQTKKKYKRLQFVFLFFKLFEIWPPSSLMTSLVHFPLRSM